MRGEANCIRGCEGLNRRAFLGGSLAALAGGCVEANESDTPPPSKILIENGFIATMDGERRVYRRGSVYIEDSRIVEVGESVSPTIRPEYVIDAENKVVLPGFVNTHSHLQQYFRGTYELIGDFYKVNLPLEGYRSPDDMEQLGLASCAEFLFGGCTTALVVYTYPDGFARACEKAGNRVILAADIEEVDLDRLRDAVYDYLPQKREAAFERATSLYRNWHGQADGRITTCMSAKAADLAIPDTFLRVKAFAEEHDLRMTTHLAQSRREVEQVRRLYGKTPTQHLHDLGILNDRLTAAHCTYTNDEDRRLIASSGTGILHCRATQNPMPEWIQMGIPVGLGTDDYHHDMLTLLRQQISGQANRRRLPGGDSTENTSFYELLELATRRGAEVLGIDNEVGSIEPGKKADIIIFDMMNPYLTPTKEPLTSIVLYGSSTDIDTVIVDGVLLKENGRLTTIDTKEALLAGQERAERIINTFFEEHPEQRRNWERAVPYS